MACIITHDESLQLKMNLYHPCTVTYIYIYIYDYMWNQLEYTAPEVGVTMTQIKTLTIRDLGSRVGPMNFNEVPCIPVDPTCVYTYF